MKCFLSPQGSRSQTWTTALQQFHFTFTYIETEHKVGFLHRGSWHTDTDTCGRGLTSHSATDSPQPLASEASPCQPAEERRQRVGVQMCDILFIASFIDYFIWLSQALTPPHLRFAVSGEQGGGQVLVQDPHVILFQSAPAGPTTHTQINTSPHCQMCNDGLCVKAKCHIAVLIVHRWWNTCYNEQSPEQHHRN